MQCFPWDTSSCYSLPPQKKKKNLIYPMSTLKRFIKQISLTPVMCPGSSWLREQGCTYGSENISHTLAHGTVKDYSSGDRDRSFQDTGGRLDLSLRTFPLLNMDNTGFHTCLVGTLLIRGSVHFKTPPPTTHTQHALRLWIWEKSSSIEGSKLSAPVGYLIFSC